MYNSGFSEAEIQQRGRWVSSCWKSYVFEGRTRCLNTAARMAPASSSFYLLRSLRSGGKLSASLVDWNQGPGSRRPP